jgi:antitoxin VapB
MQAIHEFHTAGGSTLTLNVPPEFLGLRLEVIMRPVAVQATEIPDQRPSSLEVLATMEENGEGFPDVDEGLLPLDDIRI